MAKPFTTIVVLLTEIVAVALLTAAQLHSIATSAFVGTNTKRADAVVTYLALAAGSANASTAVLATGFTIAFGLTGYAIAVDAFVKSGAVPARSSTAVITAGLTVTTWLTALEVRTHLIGATCSTIGAAEVSALKTLGRAIGFGRA